MLQDQDIMQDLKQDEANLILSYASALTSTQCPVLQQDLSLFFSNTLQNLTLVSQMMADYNWVTPQYAQDSDVKTAVITYGQKGKQLEQWVRTTVTPRQQPGAETMT